MENRYVTGHHISAKKVAMKFYHASVRTSTIKVWHKPTAYEDAEKLKHSNGCVEWYSPSGK
jgi:hypothetical protein